jgi:DNA replication and repair protein RecF
LPETFDFSGKVVACCYTLKTVSLSFLAKISLTQFRNFHRQDFNFHAPVTGITGKNGAGKTNLLDAIYYLCYTKSYFQNKEYNNVEAGHAGFRIAGEWQPGTESAEESMKKTVCIWKDGKKSIAQNGEDYAKITDHIGRFNAVMIAPDDIGIINGGSEIRRKFIDGLLAQSEPGYLDHLLAYQKNLQQKNAYLKQSLPGRIRYDLLDIYDRQLALHGAALIKEREKIALLLPEWVGTYYARLSGGREITGLQYKKSASPEDLAQLFSGSRKKDIDFKRTLNGPHTEDWHFTLDGHPLKTHASQGQKKSFLIGLKLAHIKWLQQLGKHPILLLDDIFEKLDRQRVHHLFDLLGSFSLGQIFLSHTDAEDMAATLQPYYKDLQLLDL